MSLSDADLRRLSALTPRALTGFATVYSGYSALVARMLDHPFTATEVGADAGSRPIYRMSYGSQSLPALFISACLHGSEVKAADAILGFLTRWAESSEKEYRWLRANFRCVAMPCCNPYGYDGLQYLNPNAVNLNRNFDNQWSAWSNPDPVNYKGTAPFSELETQAVRDQFLLAEPFVALDVHSSTGGGGIDLNAAVNGALYRPYIRPIEQSLAVLSAMNTITWSVGTAPTASGWYGTQNNADGYRTLASIVEIQSDTDDAVSTSYAMTGIYLFAKQALKLRRVKQRLAS